MHPRKGGVYWVLKARNNETIAVSTIGFATKSACMRNLRTVFKALSEAVVVDRTGPFPTTFRPLDPDSDVLPL